ncbi:WD40 repeat domain-containing protein, partial [Saccharothrix sp. MB29]|nr:WD40 repeat domain-containing protein [Saccharothrix sp. MB29]
MTDLAGWAANQAKTVGGPAWTDEPADPASLVLRSRSVFPGRGSQTPLWSVRFVPGTSSLICAGDAIEVLDTTTGTSARLTTHFDGLINQVAVARDGDRVLTASGNTKHAAELNVQDGSGRTARLLGMHGGFVWGVAVSPALTHVASAGGDKVIRLWDINDDNRLVHTFTGHGGGVTTVAFDASGERLFSGSSDHTVRVWDVETGRELDRLTGHSASVWSMDYDPIGNLLATGDSGGTVLLWNADTGELVNSWRHKHTGITPVAFSPAGDILAVAGSDGTIQLRNPRTGQQFEFQQRSER